MIDGLVVNASPLIVLGKAGHIPLLERSARRIVVPEAVRREVALGPTEDEARRLLERGWGSRPQACVVPHVVVEWGLGAGESEVLAVGLANPGLVVVLDDLQGRRCARSLGLPLMGTLGLILRAKRAGEIPSAAAVLRDVLRAGLRVDPELLRTVLPRMAGETWDAE